MAYCTIELVVKRNLSAGPVPKPALSESSGERAETMESAGFSVDPETLAEVCSQTVRLERQ